MALFLYIAHCGAREGIVNSSRILRFEIIGHSFSLLYSTCYRNWSGKSSRHLWLCLPFAVSFAVLRVVGL